MNSQYKLEIHHGIIHQADDRDIINMLNKYNREGYELHSITPQNGESGETEHNILIFKKI